jgi:hypothetical protein
MMGGGDDDDYYRRRRFFSPYLHSKLARYVRGAGGSMALDGRRFALGRESNAL